MARNRQHDAILHCIWYRYLPLSGRFQGLVSPPPANLSNLDPGVHFLATEGDSERASEWEGSQKRFVGGFESDIKNNVRSSLCRFLAEIHSPE